MKTSKFFITTVAVFLVSISTLLASWRPGEMEVKIYFNASSEMAELQKLQLSADVTAEYAIVYVIAEELKKIEELGFDYEVLQKNLDLRNGKGVPDGYYSYQEIIDIADSLAQHFPTICHKEIMGYSLLNRQLACLKISDNVLSDENEAEVFFDAGIHGDEVGGPQNAIMFAREIVLAYGSDPEITDLINNREIFIYLMVNPDGREDMSRYNNNGIDCNRDWGYMWDGEGGADSAFSQQEAIVLRNCLLDHQFVIHTTYHSGTEYISCPWSYRGDQSPDHDNILFLAGLYSSESGYANLDYGQGSTGMYFINGASKDFNYGAAGSVSWSMEISMSKQPPASQIEMYYNYNVPSMIAMIEYSGYGIQGVVTDAETGEPVAATIFVNDFYPVHTDPVVGDYHKYILGGTYSVTIKANGYEQVTIDNVTIDNDASTTTLDVQLDPKEGQYIQALSLVEIPGNNFDDEAYTPAIIGAPDGVYYSLGKNGFVHFDMGSAVFDKSGMDMIVYEGDDTPEGYNLYAGESMDGPWHFMGAGTGTTSFDLNTTGLINARYFKIKDDGDGNSTGDDAGFDLDGVAVPNAPVAAVEPFPANNSTLASVFSTLEWIAGNAGRPDGYKVYVGTDNPPTNMANGVNVPVATYRPDLPLDYETTYFWRVDSYNQYGEATGTLWQFTTGGEPDEDFETGDFSAFDWTFAGDANWIIDNETVRNGVYSAKSGDITDMESSSLMLEAVCSGFGKIIFWEKTSSQTNDKLEFYVNGILQESWGGEREWNEHRFNTGPGPYVFEWKYAKSESGEAGEDCAWIDFLYLPDFSDSPTANAGSDLFICEGSTVQLNGFAGNYTSLLWTTSGDGTFDDATILQPTYTPGDNDILNQQATLTLSAYGTTQMDDNLLLTIYPAAIADAGEDFEACDNGVVIPENAYVENQESVIWTSDGDGAFNDATLLQPEYTPGTEDINLGSVTLTLQANGLGECPAVSDMVMVTFISLPETPEMPTGADTTQFNLETPYTVSAVGGATEYQWQVMPEGSAEIVSNGDNNALITFLVKFETVEVSAKAVNSCGQTEWSSPKLVYVDYASGIADLQTSSFSIFPNPATDRVALRGDFTVGDVRIVNLTGQEVLRIKEYHIGDAIAVNNLKEGVYLITCTTAGEQYAAQFIRK